MRGKKGRFGRYTSLMAVIAPLAGAVLMAGSALATVQFLNDGAIPNGATGGWDLPPQGTCPAAGLNGYTGIDTRAECVALRLAPPSCVSPNYSSTTSGVCNDLVNTTQPTCVAAGDRIWNPSTSICSIVMQGDDRNDVTCMLHGGTWVTTATCIGVWVMPARTSYTPPLLTGTGPGDQCLRCHNDITQYNSPRVRDTEDTLYMGHKNMARKVVPGQAWGGPPLECDLSPLVNTTEDACEAAGGHWYPTEPYPTDDAGNPFNWVTGQITLSGTPRDLLWIYADWLSPYPRTIAKLPASSSKVCTNPTLSCSGSPSSACEAALETCVFNAGASYSCARCHTTGWTSDAVLNTQSGIEGKEPEQSFPGVTWDRLSNAGFGVVNLSPGVSGDTNKYASWDLFGITCTRCHGSAIDTTKGDASTPTQYSAPTGMSSHHSNVTAPDNSSGVCTISQWTAETQCASAGGSWLTACSINPTAGICTLGAATSGTCASPGTWVTVPAWCSNAYYTTSTDCVANGFTWQDGYCTTTDAQGACTGGSGNAAKTWRANGTKQSCELNSPAGTFQLSKCSLEGVCNKGTCSNPTYTDAVNCRDHGATWTAITTPAACTTAGGQFRYATDIIRCDDAGGHWTGNNTNRGQIITSLCMNCHRQETGGLPYANTGSGIGSESTSNPGTYVKVGAYHSTVTYPSHPHGNMFLNGAHGKFSGLFNQIATAKFGTGYGSFFQFDGEAANTGNGCTGCHNVHRSSVAGAGAEEAIKPCAECHEGQYAVDLSKINHLGGVGTPLEKAATEPSEPCIICHMPKGEHMFRINPDPAYSTFPMPAALTASAVNANAALDGTFASAVWVDVDASCGQCHGGGTAQASTTLTAATSTSSANLTVASTTGFVVGQRLTVADAGNFEYDSEGGIARGDFESYVVSVTPPNTIQVVGAPPLSVPAGKAVVQNPTANGANYRTKAVLASVAEGMHSSAGVPANVTFSLSATGRTANVTAQVSCSGTCPSFRYQWNWGDGSPITETVDPVTSSSHLYTSDGSKTVTLTVKIDSNNANNTTVGSTSRSIYVSQPNTPPTAAATCTWEPNKWKMTVVDQSSDAQGIRTIIVDWGEGPGSTRAFGTQGQTFTKIYTLPGKPVTAVTVTAIDNTLASSTFTCPAAVPTTAYFTIGGTVFQHNGTTPVASAVVMVMKGTSTVKTVYTNSVGVFSAGGLSPGSYTLKVLKGGFVFPAYPTSGTIDVGPSSNSNTINATTP